MGFRRGSLLAVGVVLVVVGAAASQSLTEVAEREKQRREAMHAHGPSRSFSDQSLKRELPGWQQFGGEAYGFHALFPGAPTVEDETDIVGALRIPRRRYLASAYGHAYSVLVKARLNGAGLTDETLLNRLQAEARVDSAGEIVGSSPLTGQLCPGVEFSVKAQRAGREHMILYRAFTCSKQLLTVAAEYGASASKGEGESEPAVASPDETAASQFLDHFVLEQS